MQDLYAGWTAASTVGVGIPENLGIYWEYAMVYGPDVTKIDRPVLMPTMPNGSKFKRPTVEVECKALCDVANVRQVEFPHT